MMVIWNIPKLGRMAVCCTAILFAVHSSRPVLGQTELSPPFEQPNIADTFPDKVTARPIAEQIKIRNTDQLLRPPFASQPTDSVKGLAAAIRHEELDTCNRVAAIQYLGTVDCKAYPEAQLMLIAALHNDKYEVARFEAAKALKCMLCGCCDPSYKQMMTSADFAGKDECPACKGNKFPGLNGGSGCQMCEQNGKSSRNRFSMKGCPPCYQKVIDFMNPRKRPDDRYISGLEACGSCCNVQVIDALSKTAHDKEEYGCWFEPSFRVRQMAAEAIVCCNCKIYPGPVEPIPEPAPLPAPAPVIIPPKPFEGERVPDRDGERVPDSASMKLFLPAPAPAAKPQLIPVEPATPVSTFQPHPTPEQAPPHLPEMEALRGFCVVGLHSQEFERSNPQIWTVYRRRIYYFADEAAKAAFEAEPERFAVRFSGMDMVEYSQSREFVEGTFLHLNDDGHLYLFASKENRAAFQSQSREFLEKCRLETVGINTRTVSFERTE